MGIIGNMSLFLRKLLFLWGLLACSFRAAAAGVDPQLKLESVGKKMAFTRSALLARPDLKRIEVANDPSYPGRTMHYQAVPLAALFESLNVPIDAVIEFQCLDGFSAPISKDRILNSDPRRSIAYIAVESADSPWPAVKSNGPSAGPFYLVWQHPELSAIAQEEWPFQLSALVVKGSLRANYPAIFPEAGASAAVERGFKLFTSNCFPCHTLNKNGPGAVGPDLNVPMNPTEYFVPAALRSLIRNPQSVRYFPRSNMSAFPEAILSDSELTDLITYLGYMAKHKKSP
jgi:mono/diheme cytochrome c family protein